uniref:Uncharacterized protein n=1 Tax=Anopheles arabiensis TaxID=7173 RepID=A0A182HYX5_ANOAR
MDRDARRGTPNEIVSDRGTNFVGANRELQEGLKDINMSKIVEELNLTSVKWTFNPPGAPHFGGAWERVVQSVKKTLANIQFTKHHQMRCSIMFRLIVKRTPHLRQTTSFSDPRAGPSR